MNLFGRATTGENIVAKQASVAQHVPELRILLVSSLATCFAALVLAVTLYRITRETDSDVARLAMTCRVAEAATGGIFLLAMRALLWLGTAPATSVRISEGEQIVATVLFKILGWNSLLGAMFFAVGSTLFSLLFLRGHTVPDSLAWLGIIASILLVLVLPLQLVGIFPGSVGQLIWLPMVFFEAALALWLIIKGVRSTEAEATSIRTQDRELPTAI